MIDLKKPLQTKSGKSVRIIYTDYKAPYPVFAFVERESGIKEFHSYTLKGEKFIGKKTEEDLINTKGDFYD